MAIYHLGSTCIEPIPETTFSAMDVRERRDLQRMLRTNIAVIDDNALVIAEEFGEWEDSKRRIDLLAIDKNANLIVIELKRTADGGHMELQALRYAAMVSTMTFERALELYTGFLVRIESTLEPRESLLQFLEWDEPQEELFAQDVRIVLASADFSKEVTTTVMWLNERGLDIRCVRVKPYLHNDTVLLDVQQLIPLPEAEAFTVGIREKKERERIARATDRDLTKYDVTLDGAVQTSLAKRIAILRIVQHLCRKGVTPEGIASAIPWRAKRMFCKTEGRVTAEEFVRREQSRVDSGGMRRYFCDENDLIHANGCTYAFSNQWGNRTFSAIETLIAAHPDKGVACRSSGPAHK